MPEEMALPTSSSSAPASPPASAFNKAANKFPTTIPIRSIALVAFVLVALLACTVTVRHVFASSSSSSSPPIPPAPSPSVPSSSSPGPAPFAQQQLSAPPIATQLDSLRASVVDLQKAIGDLQMKMSQSSSSVATQAQQQQQQYWPFYERQLARRQMAWQPMKRRRMVQWQPVKRENSYNNNNNDYYYYGGGGEGDDGSSPREQVILAIEQQLSDVLQAGERLGVSAQEILAHLRARNGLA